MTLFSLQQKIAADLRARLSQSVVGDIIGHRGQFESIKEIQKVALRKTALLVCYREFGNCQKIHGGVQADVDWVIYVVARDVGGKARDEVASAIGNFLVRLLYGNCWGVAIKRPEKIRGRNVTTHAIDNAGVCIWAITWTQCMPITDAEMPDLYDWLSTEIDTDLTPDDSNDEPQMKAVIDMTLTP